MRPTIRFAKVLFLAVSLPFTGAVARAQVVWVTPTNTPADFDAVRAALASATAGTTVILGAGTFDFSLNDLPVAPYTVATGVPIPVSNLTIEGELVNGKLATVITGRTSGDGLPVIEAFPPNAANAAFANGPGATGVTIRNLRLRNFEVAIILRQTSDANPDFAPGADFSVGADDFTVENIAVENSTQGVHSLGANDRLIVRDSSFEIVNVVAFGVGARFINSSAVGVTAGRQVSGFPFQEPAHDVVIEGNSASGPGPGATPRLRSDGTPDPRLIVSFGFNVEGGVGARLEGNRAQNFSFCHSVAADGVVRAIQNSASGCQLGLSVADFGPPAVNASTRGALVRNNTLKDNVGVELTPAGILVFADDNQLLGNNVNNTQAAGILLDDSATGNLIIGNGNVVVGSAFALANNTITGMQTAPGAVALAVRQLLVGNPPN